MRRLTTTPTILLVADDFGNCKFILEKYNMIN